MKTIFKKYSPLILLIAVLFTSCKDNASNSKREQRAETTANAGDTANFGMPKPNPWLAASTFPISHDNSAATDAVDVAGPTQGKQLTANDVKTVAALFTCSPTIKKIGNETVIIGAGCDGVRKVRATGEAFELVSYLPYPGLEYLQKKTGSSTVAALLEKVNKLYRKKDDAGLLLMTNDMEKAGFGRKTIANGAYNMIDKDGYHYALYGGMKILKSGDDNVANRPLRVIKFHDFMGDLPPEGQKAKPHFVGIGMLYNGNIVAAAHSVTYSGLMMIDRDLNYMASISFPGEEVENSIATDEKGIYVVTSRNMYKVVWTGSKLSFDEADGGWKAGYNTMSREQATAAGALTMSGGSGTTPTLMGFGEGEDKLVVISDADPTGIHIVAFWRDNIPGDFQQKAGTRSRRIADQALVDISKVTIEPSPIVLGYGVCVINSTYQKPVPDIWGNAMTAGVTRPAPVGVQKFTWNPKIRSFEKNWINNDIDNTDVMVPVISAKSKMAYFANKAHGIYEYAGIDWNTGKIIAHWPFPDDSRIWNAYGGITALMEDGDIMFGGLFSMKRINIGPGK